MSQIDEQKNSAGAAAGAEPGNALPLVDQPGAAAGAEPGNALPLVDQPDASAGSSPLVSRQDHVHPTDTTRAAIDSPNFTGTPTAPTPPVSDSTTRIATAAFVRANTPIAGGALPLANGASNAGTSSAFSREDHVHPTDTTRAPVVSPNFTGSPRSTTPSPYDDSTRIANTSWVKTYLGLAGAPIDSPAFTGNPTAPTPVYGDNSSSIATTAFVVANAGGGGTPSDDAPKMDGFANAGVSEAYSRGDHVHPTDESRAPIVSPSFMGNPTVPSPEIDDQSEAIPNTAWVRSNITLHGGGAPSDALPMGDGTASAGTATTYARGDHVHPQDTTRAPIDSPDFTGYPRAPTPDFDDISTAIATTEFVAASIYYPSDDMPLSEGPANPGSSIEFSRSDHVHDPDPSLAPINSPAFTGNPTAPTKPANDISNALATTSFVSSAVATVAVPSASNVLPSGPGTASAGTSTAYSRGDHVHPTDTTRAAVVSPAFTGTPTAPTQSVNDVSNAIATTSFVSSKVASIAVPVASNVLPSGPGTASAGTSETYSRGDHVHPTDTTRAGLDSPAFTGIPTAPTQTGSDNSNAIATTAFVKANGGGVSPSSSSPQMDGTASAGTSTAYSRGDHVHPTDTTRAPLASPAFTGTPTAPTQSVNDVTNAIATTSFVSSKVASIAMPVASNVLPSGPGTASAGTSATYSRGDHVHPTDTTRAGLASPAFTGIPTAPTQPATDNSNAIATTAFVKANGGTGPQPYNLAPKMDGSPAAGSATTYARGDHVHPSDTTRAPIDSPFFTGMPMAPTQASSDNSNAIATTAFVKSFAGGPSPADQLPKEDSDPSIGTSTKYARMDHVHPTDATRAPINSPAFSGNATAPNVAPTSSGQQIATTFWCRNSLASNTSGNIPNPLINGVARAGTSDAYSRADHVHPTDTTRAAAVNAMLTGAPTATTPDFMDVSTRIATTEWVASGFVPIAALASPPFNDVPTDPPASVNGLHIATTSWCRSSLGSTPCGVVPLPHMNGAAPSAGTTEAYSRTDHVHPTDTTRAPVENANLMGQPTATTPDSWDVSTRIATTEWVASGYVPVSIFLTEIERMETFEKKLMERVKVLEKNLMKIEEKYKK